LGCRSAGSPPVHVTNEGITMVKRTRLVVATATLAALAATGTASAAAASGPTPPPGGGKSDSAPAQTDPKSTANADAEFAALAARLGVTADQLDAAMIAAKTSGVTHETFLAAVATNLGLPLAQVQEVLRPMITKPEPDHPKPGVPNDPQPSPLLTDAAAASVASTLGVDQAQAKAALAAVDALASATGRSDPLSQPFADVAAGLGVSADQLETALRTFKLSLGH
jgi:hypothetical protein